jgi:hypothetical protein
MSIAWLPWEKRLTWRSLLLLCTALISTPGRSAGVAETNVFVRAAGLWQFLDDGSNQGTNWRTREFDASQWLEGFAQFGYGDFDEETELYFGPSESNKFITYYFRKEFTAARANTYARLTLRLLRDDGAVVYLNGREIYRDNMPPGTVDYRTLASTNVSGSAEDIFYSTDLAALERLDRANVLAVEVHQRVATSADLSFDLELTGVTVPVEVTRGPYLQQGSTTNIVVRWRTNVPTDSRVRLYDSVAASFIEFAGDALVTEHELRLTNLVPDRLYFYSIGNSEELLAGDGDASYYFVTAPNHAKPTRIWVIGDSGTANQNARAVYNAFHRYGQGPSGTSGGPFADVWLMLGDNAYGIGTDTEYQAAVFNMYPDLLRKTVLWSTIGNHETYSGTLDDFPFLHIFSQPANGECGGVPSGTEKYFSFDYGNIHFVCLDAMSSDRSSNGPMCTWLKQDLTANTNDWLIAFWHHPPYTKGSHNSDTEVELIEMRENAVPLLESFGVDLVLSGHSHCYERSFLINGHYGPSGTFTQGMKKSPGGGNDNDVHGFYRKPIVGPDANQGTVYVVAGSSGQVGGGALNHPAMFYDALRLGSLLVDINGPRLDAWFLNSNGFVDDAFTILKGATWRPLTRIDHQLQDGMLRLTWDTRPDRWYGVQQATDLKQASWEASSSTAFGTGERMSFDLPICNHDECPPPGVYYRVVEMMSDDGLAGPWTKK